MRIFRSEAFDKTVAGLALPQLFSNPQHQQHWIAHLNSLLFSLVLDV